MWSILNLDLIAIVLATLCVLLLLYYGTYSYEFWNNLCVPYKKPKLPFLGNLFQAEMSLRPTCAVHQEYYKYFSESRFFGLFSFRTPILIIKDPALVEAVLVKDFTSFYNRGTDADTDLDPLAAHLLNLTGKKWRRLRQNLSPTFTSGKLKIMQPLLIECADKLLKRCSLSAENKQPIECKDMMGKFSTDVIGSCAFGLDLEAMDNPNSKFRTIVKLSARSSPLLKLRTALRGKLPRLLKLLQWKNQPQEVEDYFFSFVKNAVAFRETNKIYRNDFLQLMIEIKNQDATSLNNMENDEEEPIGLDDKQMTASTYQFLAAGFATTALTLTFCLYELSVNQDIQKKVYEEIIEVLEKHEGQFTYQAIKEMKYLNQIFSETLRMHPPAPALNRKSTKDYQIPDTNIIIPGGTTILIPIYSIHHDPQYYTDPEKFLPERFSDDNKEQIKKYTYLPFGDGPRTCIASRFAKMEILTGLSKLIHQFRITLNPKTKSQMVYKKSGTFVEPSENVLIDLHKR
ncbi:cytochrome P450 6a2-like isoform X1 [Rhodnius prolixus]|uniref:cytochrome P450 6a2-like isoform X1 n=1 Tax=Rhodnius prolixus TaxID=13249 RepID=UPI003D18CF73